MKCCCNDLSLFHWILRPTCHLPNKEAKLTLLDCLTPRLRLPRSIRMCLARRTSFTSSTSWIPYWIG
ncbi:hypothetical protein Pdw03_2500 [Penicillium digitatum]|uniref:Uncharacterized protein n=1 Tax=Penicillium digitatum TaxID=36651 RepID=A0A7T7BH68_PENDI|nr:hypothetical protein Pdw03_2500 [Penicillium digitatum]